LTKLEKHQVSREEKKLKKEKKKAIIVEVTLHHFVVFISLTGMICGKEKFYYDCHLTNTRADIYRINFTQDYLTRERSDWLFSVSGNYY
jgi:hypothetical protein